jgi:hypothetical protein
MRIWPLVLVVAFVPLSCRNVEDATWPDDDGPEGTTDSETGPDVDPDTDDDSATGGGAPQAGDCVRYVDADVGSPGDGLSWAEALVSVQEGIDSARAAVIADPQLYACRVWVAAGTYHVFGNHPDDTILLRPGVEVYGGFAGFETDLEERDFAVNETILDGRAADDPGSRVCHVVTGEDGARIDGFTVRSGGGCSGGGWDIPPETGGGIYNHEVSPTIANCAFVDNLAHWCGGAVYNYYGSPAIVDCRFENNGAEECGGAIYTFQGAPLVIGSLFAGNHAARGGAMVNEDGSPTVESCRFFDNEGGSGGGGAMHNSRFWDGSEPLVLNCVFAGNTADFGGAIANEGGDPTLVNCTFFGNLAQDFGGAISNTWESSTAVLNSILWNDYPDEIHNSDSSIAVQRSDVAGGFAGAGNIDADPLFQNAVGDLYRIIEGSPCIDAADGTVAPEFDAEGHSRVDDAEAPNAGIGPPWADMGAFEHQP